MPTYEFHMTRDTTETCQVRIKAETIEEAHRRALEADGSNWQWEPDDENFKDAPYIPDDSDYREIP